MARPVWMMAKSPCVRSTIVDELEVVHVGRMLAAAQYRARSMG
jgi:hypothetical protein